MGKFKRGDEIRRHGKDYNGTVNGGIYTVADCYGNHVYIHGLAGVFDATRFELVVEEDAGWDYAVADRLHAEMVQAVQDYNDYIQRKPLTHYSPVSSAFTRSGA